jgi:hypothetical protein
MRNFILLTVFTSILLGCTSQEVKKKQEELHEQKLVDKKHEQKLVDKKKKVIANIKTKYNITFHWNDLSYPYSIDYKPVIETKYQLIDFEGPYISQLIDIYTKNGTEFVSLKIGIMSTFFFDFPITKEQENKFRSGHELILIVSIDEIRKLRFELAGEIEDKDSEVASVALSYSEFGLFPKFIGKGKIIDIVPMTK